MPTGTNTISRQNKEKPRNDSTTRMPSWCKGYARQRRHSKMAVSRHLGFYRTGNSAIWSTAFKLYCDLETGVRDHSRSSKVALFDRAHMTLYSSSIVTMHLGLSITISEILPHIGRKLPPPCIWRPRWGWTCQICATTLGDKNSERVSMMRWAVLTQSTRVTELAWHMTVARNKKVQQSWQTSTLAMHLPLARLISMPVIFCLLPTSSIVILVFYLFSTRISEQHVWEPLRFIKRMRTLSVNTVHWFDASSSGNPNE